MNNAVFFDRSHAGAWEPSDKPDSKHPAGYRILKLPPSDFHVVQVDNARFHRSKALVMPDNVMLLYQPSYSPQVNSAERFWQ